jgi:hypothetical protein
MCLLALLYRVAPDAPVGVGGNREEFYARGGEPPQMLDGAAVAGGTWLEPDELPPERLRAVRAVQVLEYAGTAEARRLLKGLAGGAEGAGLTSQAKQALGRLARRPAAPR